MRLRALALPLLLATGAALAACGGDDPTGPARSRLGEPCGAEIPGALGCADLVVRVLDSRGNEASAPTVWVNSVPFGRTQYGGAPADDVTDPEAGIALVRVTGVDSAARTTARVRVHAGIPTGPSSGGIGFQTRDSVDVTVELRPVGETPWRYDLTLRLPAARTQQ